MRADDAGHGAATDHGKPAPGRPLAVPALAAGGALRR